MTNSFLYTVNKSIRNKAQSDQMHLLTTRYKNKKGSLEDIKKDIKEGFALASAQTDGLSRCDAHFKRSQTIFIDIDNGWAINEAVSAEIVQNYFRLIYTTPSHTEENHRFRILGILPVVIDDKLVYKKTVEIALEKFKAADTSCKDACRAFYGSTTAIFPFQNDDNYIPIEWVDEAHERAIAERELESLRLIEAEKRRQQFEALSEEEKNALYSEIEKALMYIPGRRPGTGTYKETMGVLRALLNHYGEHQAIQIAERWNPSTPDFNVAQKIRSFRGKADKVSIGTIFHYAYQNGYQFPNRNPFKTREEFIKTFVIPVANPKELIESETLALTISQSIEGYKSIKVDTDKLKGFTYTTYIKVLKKEIKKTKASQLLIVGLWSEAELLNTLISIAQSLRIDFSLSIENQIIGVENFRIEVSRRQKVERIKAECDRLSALTHQPTLKLNQKYLPEFKLSDAQLYLIKSATGTGKTEQMKNFIAEVLELTENAKIINLTYRNALSKDTSVRCGLAHVHDLTESDLLSEQALSMCVNSLMKINIDDIVQGSALIFDEVEAILYHTLIGSTCRKDRKKIIKQLTLVCQTVIERGGYILAMEANLTDRSVNLFRNICGLDVKYELIVNEYETQKFPITLLDSKEKTVVFDRILEDLNKGEKLMFVSTTRNACEELHKTVSMLLPNKKIMRVDGSTSGSEIVKAFLSDINGVSNREKFDLLILSPSLESGGNITTNLYQKVYFYASNRGLRAVVQMLARLRTDVPRIGIVRDHDILNYSAALTVNHLRDQIRLNVQESNRMCELLHQPSFQELAIELSGLNQDWSGSLTKLMNFDTSLNETLFFQTALEMQSRDYCSAVRLRDAFVEYYKDRDFCLDLEECQESKEAKKLNKAVKEAIETDEIEKEIKAKSDLTEEQISEISKNSKSTPEQRLDVRLSKLNLRTALRLDLTDKETVKFLLHKENGKALEKVELLASVLNPEKALLREQRFQANAKDALATDLRFNLLKVQFLIQDLNILEILKENERVNDDSEVVQRIYRIALQNADKCKRVLGLAVTDKTGAFTFVSRLLKSCFGLKFKSERKGGRKDQKYFYYLEFDKEETYTKVLEAAVIKLRQERVFSDRVVITSLKEKKTTVTTDLLEDQLVIFAQTI